MNITTRRYSRTRREAFPLLYRESALGIEGPIEVGHRSVFTRLRIWLRNLINR